MANTNPMLQVYLCVDEFDIKFVQFIRKLYMLYWFNFQSQTAILYWRAKMLLVVVFCLLSCWRFDVAATLAMHLHYWIMNVIC